MAPKKDEGTSGPIDELVARFQLESEGNLKFLAEEVRKAMARQDQQVASLSDSWRALEQEARDMRRVIDDGLNQMRSGVSEVNIALRRAVESAAQAEQSAKVYEKLRASQPDFIKAVQALEKKVASVQDSDRTTRDAINALSRRLDQFEGLTSDYQEVRGEVRNMDRIVTDLNGAEQRRRRGVAG